ncbi:MAG: hypothetical protein ABJA37_11070 [Ferruginibacter sp.]
MENKNLAKAGISVLILVTTFLISWEAYWRGNNFPASYNDDASFWSTKRREVYKPADEATIFIGSSRIKYDLDISTWEKLTGEKAIQLAMVGTSPRPLLDDLAQDKKFNGKLIIDVTEGLFFGRNKKRTEKSAVEGVEYYKKWTPAQKFSATVNNFLESEFVFLDKDKFGLNELISELGNPKRKGVFERPHFPKGFGNTNSQRQSYMAESFLNDTSQQKRQQQNWMITGGASDKTPAIKGDTLEIVFRQVKAAIDNIRARGGKVLFVRTPSSGTYWQTEQLVYPREKYWDALLAYTNTPGIYFKDYPETASLTCPEWSHLKPADAILFTENFVRFVQQKGWTFFHKPAMAVNTIKLK